MDRMRDFAACSKAAFKRFRSTLGKTYTLFIIITIQTFFHSATQDITWGGSFTGVLIYLMDIVFYSYCAQCLHSIVFFGNSGKKSLDCSIGNYFWPMTSAMFVVILFQWLLELLISPLGHTVYLVCKIIYQFMISAVVEIVYIRGNYRSDIILESGRFVRKNRLNWGLYALIFTLFSSYFQDLILANTKTSSELFLIVLYSLARTLIKVFQGHLFKILDDHSYSQRKFMRDYE